MLDARLKGAALIGFWFGFGYFFAGLYWVAEAFLVEPWRHAWLIPFVMTALPAGMALFFVAATTLAMLMWWPGGARAFALAIAFGLAEYARGHVLTGLPWNLVGYALTDNGGHDATRLAVRRLCLEPDRRAACSPVRPAIVTPDGIAPRRVEKRRRARGLTPHPLGARLRWGERRLANAGIATTDIRLRIVQADIDQADKWRPENSAEIFNDYLDLTKSGAAAGSAALPSWSGRRRRCRFFSPILPMRLSLIGEALPEGTSLLVGSARLVEERDAQGALTATSHL